MKSRLMLVLGGMLVVLASLLQAEDPSVQGVHRTTLRDGRLTDVLLYDFGAASARAVDAEESSYDMMAFTFMSDVMLPSQLNLLYSLGNVEHAESIGLAGMQTGNWYRVFAPIEHADGEQAENVRISVKRRGPSETYQVDEVLMHSMPLFKGAGADSTMEPFSVHNLHEEPTYILQASTDLMDGNWVNIAYIHSTNSPLNVYDPDRDTYPNRVYRVVFDPVVPLDSSRAASGLIQLPDDDEQPDVVYLSVQGQINPGTIAFGDYTFDLPNGATPTGVTDGYFNYQVYDAALMVTLPMDSGSVTREVEGITLAFDRKTNDRDVYKNVTFSWDGSGAVFDYEAIALALNELSGSISTNGLLSGTFGLDASATANRELVPGIRVTASGSVTAQVAAASTWSAADTTWNFSGVNTLSMDLFMGTKSMASVSGALAADGRLTRNFPAVSVWQTQAGDTLLTLSNLTLGVRYDAQGADPLTVTSVSGSAMLGNPGGQLPMSLSYLNNQMHLALAEGDHLLVTELAGAPLHLTLSGLTADYDFETFTISAVSGTGVLGQGAQALSLTASAAADGTSMALTAGGAGALALELGGAPLNLSVTSLTLNYNFTDVQVAAFSGSGTLGAGSTAIPLTLVYDAAQKALHLSGKGSTLTTLGGTELELNFTSLQALYDFDSVRVLSAAGTGLLGTGKRKASVSIGCDTNTQSLALTAAGAFDCVVASAPCYMNVVTMSALYNFEELTVTGISGSGTLGYGTQPAVFSLDNADGNIVLTGRGAFDSQLGAVPMTLDLSSFTLQYDFADTRVAGAAGTAKIGLGSATLPAQVGYDQTRQAMTFSGSGNMAASVADIPLLLKLDAWNAQYDFDRVRVQNASGTAQLGEGAGAVSLTIQTNAAQEGIHLASGSGTLAATLGAAPLLLHFTALEADYDFNRLYFDQTAATGTLGTGSEKMALTASADVGSRALALKSTGSGWVTAQVAGERLALNLSLLHMLYDLETGRVTQVAGNTSWFGEGSQKMKLSVSQSPNAEAIRLSGSGVIEPLLAGEELQLNLKSMVADYDFNVLRIVELGSGSTGAYGVGSQQLGLQVEQAPAVDALLLTGSTGMVNLAFSGTDLELNVSNFKAVYDFDSVSFEACSGQALLGEGANSIPMSFSLAPLRNAMRVNGGGEFECALGQSGCLPEHEHPDL